jgi:hypothetical protein
MRKCAYCGCVGELTKEHLFPNAILSRRRGRRVYSSNSVPDRFIGPASMQIRDVCATCNNERLSSLDSYFVGLYDEYISTPIRRDESIRFRYDYGLLLRWLLKTFYNSARAGGANEEHQLRLSQYAVYVLQGGRAPSEILTYLQLVIPDSSGEEENTPSYITCGEIVIPSWDYRYATPYVLGIDSYRFLLFFLHLTNRAARRHVQKMIAASETLNDATRVFHAESESVVHASTITARDVIGPLVVKDAKKWAKHLFP